MSSCSGTTDCDCGCCAGTSVQTPQPRSNAGGLPAVSYRVGTWSSFKESMLARLSSADYPALQALKTRSDDDFTIAFLNSTAMVLDILTFYQERLANESYLRTAGQLRSLTELSRLIGYQPAPGVSASAYLAFILKPTPGQPPNPTRRQSRYRRAPRCRVSRPRARRLRPSRRPPTSWQSPIGLRCPCRPA